MIHVSWPVVIGGWVIAAVMAIFAWRQSQTSRDQLRFQLFDKRISIYHDLVDQMRLIVQLGDCSDESLVNMNSLIKRSAFLFGDDVLDHMEVQTSKALGIHIINKELETEQEHEKRSNLARRHTEIVRWFHDDLGEINKLFEVYLSFSHHRATPKFDLLNVRIKSAESATFVWSKFRTWSTDTARSSESST